MKVMTMKIKDTVVIPYPADELGDLKELLSRDGMASAISENTEVSRPTINSIADTGFGQKGKIDKLRDFVKRFNKQFPQSARA